MEQLAADFVDSDSDAELQQVDLNCGGSTFTTLVDGARRPTGHRMACVARARSTSRSARCTQIKDHCCFTESPSR